MKKMLALLFLLSLSLLAQPFPHTITVTIAQGASLSDAVLLREGTHPAGACTPGAIIMPSAWDTGNLTFQVSVLGSTYQNLYDEFGTEVTVTAAASRTIRLSPADWWSVGLFIKVRSGTSGTAVTQTAARTLQIVCR